MDKAETQKYVQQLRAEIKEKAGLIDSLRAENKRLKMKAIDMEFCLYNLDGDIYESVKEIGGFEVTEWLESEIERTKEYLTVEYSTVFNGVDVKSNELRKELLQAHIKFCELAMINARAEDEQTEKMRSQINILKAEVEKYKKAFEDANKERKHQVWEL